MTPQASRLPRVWKYPKVPKMDQNTLCFPTHFMIFFWIFLSRDHGVLPWFWTGFNGKLPIFFCDKSSLILFSLWILLAKTGHFWSKHGQNTDKQWNLAVGTPAHAMQGHLGVLSMGFLDYVRHGVPAACCTGTS